MTEQKTEGPRTAKQKRARHANAQASYMERKRAEGKEWLATWVPGEAKECFKNLARLANEDSTPPTTDYIEAVEAAVDEEAPKWAKENLSLFNIWLIGTHKVQIDFQTDAKKEKKTKKKKKKKEK